MDEMGMPLEPYPPQDCHKEGTKIVRYHMLGQKQKITIIECGSAIPPFIVFVAIQVNYLWTRNGVCGLYFAVLTMDE